MARAGDSIDRAEIGRAVEACYNNLHGVLGQERLRLRALTDVLGAQDVENAHLWEAVIACRVLTRLLDKALTDLLKSADTMRGTRGGDHSRRNQPNEVEGTYELVSSSGENDDTVRFRGIAEDIYLLTGFEHPVVGREYVIVVRRDEDGDLVLLHCEEIEPERPDNGT